MCKLEDILLEEFEGGFYPTWNVDIGTKKISVLHGIKFNSKKEAQTFLSGEQEIAKDISPFEYLLNFHRKHIGEISEDEMKEFLAL